MKLGFITNHPVGTSETFVYELIRGLELEYGLNNVVHLAGSTIGKKVVSKSYFSNFGVKKKYYKHFDNFERVAKLNWRSTFKLRRRVAEQAFERLPKPDTPEIVYIEFGQPAVLFRRYLERHRIPMVVHFHGMDASSAFNSSTYREEIQQVFRYASNIITASHHIRRLLVLQGCPPEKIRVVRYGIKVAEIKPKNWEQRVPHPAVIFLGRLTEKKNPLALVHSFNLVKNSIEDARLTIVGDGPLRSEVENLVKKLGLTDSITMHGKLAHEVALENGVASNSSVEAISGRPSTGSNTTGLRSSSSCVLT
jgi:glycosyltransferase involved in cell wall biosynthesis